MWAHFSPTCRFSEVVMLAERRKKVRYSNNPCGNLWANDRCGFGRQMLERLGWIPGNGLGKNGDGIEKPIKV